MNHNINLSQCEIVINEGVSNIVNMGRILNVIKSSQSSQTEYEQIEMLLLNKWGIQSSELDTIINIFKKAKK